MDAMQPLPPGSSLTIAIGRLWVARPTTRRAVSLPADWLLLGIGAEGHLVLVPEGSAGVRGWKRADIDVPLIDLDAVVRHRCGGGWLLSHTEIPGEAPHVVLAFVGADTACVDAFDSSLEELDRQVASMPEGVEKLMARAQLRRRMAKSSSPVSEVYLDFLEGTDEISF